MLRQLSCAPFEATARVEALLKRKALETRRLVTPTTRAIRSG
jgi:hypothetical protein